jgi:uncharacterized protein
MNPVPVLQAILEDFDLPLSGDHVAAHLARVLENSLRQAEETGAHVDVVSSFAVLHHSRRINEVTDPQHCPSAAEFAAGLQGNVFEVDSREFRPLFRDCECHTHQLNHPNVTIQACWGSDRLDLGQVGIMSQPNCLWTEVARRPEKIKWAADPANFCFVPKLVPEAWGIDPEKDSACWRSGR